MAHDQNRVRAAFENIYSFENIYFFLLLLLVLLPLLSFVGIVIKLVPFAYFLILELELGLGSFWRAWVSWVSAWVSWASSTDSSWGSF